MENYVICTLIMLCVLSADAEWVRISGRSEVPIPPTKEVIKSDSSGVLIRNIVFGYTEEDTTIDNKYFTRIQIPDGLVLFDSADVGKPEVPFVRLLVAIPDSVSIEIGVKPISYTVFDDFLLYPVPAVIYYDSAGWIWSREEYIYDENFYQLDTLYPTTFYEIASDGHWRDQRVLEIFIYPIQYNPLTEVLLCYDILDIRITYDGVQYANENGLGPFEQIGRAELLNYPGIDKEPESVPTPVVHYYTELQNTNNIADYIIVTHEVFLASEQESLKIHEFAEWRVAHNQYHVGIVKICDIYEEWAPGDDSARALRDFLIYAYNNWGAGTSDGHFAYCLFIGDWDYVPIKTYMCEYQSGWGFSDELDEEWLNAWEGYFRDIDSELIDRRDDIMLGRWPVKEYNSIGLLNIIEKTISYEQSQTPNQGDWRRRGLLVGGPGPGYGYVLTNVKHSKPLFADIGYDTTILLTDDATYYLADSIHKYLNEGEIIMAYYGHGGPCGWAVPPGGYGFYHAETLANDDRLGVILSYACNTAMFHVDHPYYENIYQRDTCLGEEMLWNPNSGAVAFYGAASVLYMNTYNPIPTRRALREQQWILGEMLINAYKRFCYNDSANCYCLLGDPALDLGDYTAYPDMPDLVVRPRALDISVLPPYPYASGGDQIPLHAKILNNGGATAQNADVQFEVKINEGVVFSETVTFDEINPREYVDTTVYWNTAQTNPGYYGILGEVDFVVTADPNNDISETWELNNKSDTTDSCVLYPYDDGWPIQVSGYSQPAIANLDDAGSAEIVYVSDGSVYVFDEEGNVLSGWPQLFEGVYATVLGDINGDDNVEIIAVSPYSINVYDANGNTMTGWPQNIDDNDLNFCGYPALGNINSDNDLDIVVFASPSPPNANNKVRLYVYDNDGGQPLYNILIGDLPISTYYSLGPSVADIVSSGNDDIAICFVNAPDAESGPKTYIANSTGDVDNYNFGNWFMIPALADLDGDEYADIVVGCSNDTIIAYSVASDDTVWATGTDAPINSSPAIGDIHPGVPYPGVEVTFGSDASETHLLWGTDGTPILPQWPYTISSPIHSSAAIANINGDGDQDIIISADNYYFYAFNYNAEDISPFPLHVHGHLTSPVIGDIDGDKRSEIVLASADGYLHVWETKDCKVPPYTIEWPQFHHDYQRTGLHNWVDDARGGKPNPKSFSTSTTVSFTLEKETDTKIKIYDEQGESVKTLVNQTLPSGTYNPVWYGKDDNFVLLPEGIYFIEIKLKNQTKIIPVEIDR